MLSQRGSLVGENRSILPPTTSPGSKAASCISSCGSKSFCSCVPWDRVAGARFVTCPTCQGSGVIPQELEKQLVALIPYGDQRLKPRRTKLFVFLAVLISLVTSSLLSFALFPHSISVQPVGLNSSTVAFDQTEVHINITSILNISNSNYYPITVTQLTIEALHVALVVGQVSLSLRLRVGPLATQQQNLFQAGIQSPPRAFAHPGHTDVLLPQPFRAEGLREPRIRGLPFKLITGPHACLSPALTLNSRHRSRRSVSATIPCCSRKG
ncbi:transmembrane protein 106A isoform X1 [Sorex araneus]|uniref:transmembrane protein 106A isoform X1 n=1 Tax=Sorex araneus TaxID=42254 RepID=UPI002433EC62|nr:transmembrane protein 106A isoform X1 [Sorex araneus]XP_054988629.1 transmembrane protein 106A isoform X1 [Sorex araneus]